MNQDARYLSPAEIVRRLPVSVRALKLYERQGLLTPIRTSAGWRTYGPAQVARLHEILALKGLGLSLARIGELLAGRAADLGQTLELQVAALRAQRARIDAALRLIEAAQQKLRRGEPLPIQDLVELIQETTMKLTEAYIAKLQSQLTPDEFDRLMNGAQNSKSELVGELKALAARGEDPGSPTAFDFMRRWIHSQRLSTGGDESIEAKARDAWAEVLADPELADSAPYNAAESAYLHSIGAALRAELVRLFGRLETLAREDGDPESVEAVALVFRLRNLSTVSRGYWSKAWNDARRARWQAARSPMPGVTVSEAGLAFLLRASARTDALLEAA